MFYCTGEIISADTVPSVATELRRTFMVAMLRIPSISDQRAEGTFWICRSRRDGLRAYLVPQPSEGGFSFQLKNMYPVLLRFGARQSPHRLVHQTWCYYARAHGKCLCECEIARFKEKVNH